MGKGKKVKKETREQFVARVEAEKAKFLEDNKRKVWKNPKHQGKKKRKRKQSGAEEVAEAVPTLTPRDEAAGEEAAFATKPKSSRAPKDNHGKPVFSWHFFRAFDAILLLGEGNFSFARSLAQALRGLGKAIYATTLDTEGTCFGKYPEAEGVVGELRALGVSVFFDVDCTDLAAARAVLPVAGVDCMVFMFPHVGLGIDDQRKNVMANRALLEGTFATADNFLREGGRLAITLKTGMPYDSWNVTGLGSREGWRQAEAMVFQVSRWKGYEFRRTKGILQGEAKNAHVREATCRTFVFERKAEALERNGGRSEVQERKERERFIALRPHRGKKNKRKLMRELERKDQSKRKKSGVEREEDDQDDDDDYVIQKYIF